MSLLLGFILTFGIYSGVTGFLLLLNKIVCHFCPDEEPRKIIEYEEEFL